LESGKDQGKDLGKDELSKEKVREGLEEVLYPRGRVLEYIESECIEYMCARIKLHTCIDSVNTKNSAKSI
jgi:hypothetical protein